MGSSDDGVRHTIIGGTHKSFAYFASIAGGAAPLICLFTAGLQQKKEGRMPRIALNPLTLKEMQVAKMSNMQLDHVEGMEKLMGEDGSFKKFGARQTAGQLACCEEEFDMSHCHNITGFNDTEIKPEVPTNVDEDLAEKPNGWHTYCYRRLQIYCRGSRSPHC